MTNAEFGLLYSAYSVPNVVVPLFGGILLDRIGVRLGLLICLYLVAVGTGIVAMAPHFENSFFLMLLGRFIFGYNFFFFRSKFELISFVIFFLKD